MSTARDRSERLRRRSTEQKAAETAAETAPPQSEPGPPDRPVRQTYDLPRKQHDAFSQWRLETALSLGRNRLSAQDALTAMTTAVLTDETVARRVRALIERPRPDDV